MKQVVYSKAALHVLQRDASEYSGAHSRQGGAICTGPAVARNNVRALQGESGHLRLRVGDWRIIFTEDGRVVAIIRISPRGSAYE
ncbi:type II toxin-antitoxin system RelE/ParE family toxin [Prosthecomicrobium pneumaticum]|uniref:mRNA interferase RelE/StbE n=1 Tax=Prosthecomicrobium pneumaticum TaxID=81895 RepID=A0A7W9CTW2_9HYPH|nr:mRNA interferase RelE/StbE [Prosthecomicrobium pneumaticum]